MDKREHNEKKCQKMVLHERSVGMYDEGSGISVRTTQHINTTTKTPYIWDGAAYQVIGNPGPTGAKGDKGDEGM